MCGIVGFLDKSRSHEHAAVGRILIEMLRALACRGPDSTGVAVFGLSLDGNLAVRVKLGDDGQIEPRVKQLVDLLESLGVKNPQLSIVASYARFIVGGDIGMASLIAAIERLNEEIEVVSVGHEL